METEIIKDDRGYFNAWHDIFVKIDSKSTKLRRPVISAAKAQKAQDAEASEDPEQLWYRFLEQVRVGKAEGRTYLFEDVAERFQLSDFEKRVFLAMFSFDLEGRFQGYAASKLINMLEWSGTAAERLLRYQCFQKDSALLKYKLLRRTGELLSPEIKVRLNQDVFSRICKGMNGVEISWEDLRVERSRKKKDTKRFGDVRSPGHCLDDVIIDEETRQKIEIYLKGFKSLSRDKKRKRGKYFACLLYGPPGTGKTMLAEAIAQYLNRKVLNIRYEEVVNPYIGVSEENIANLFESGKNNVIIINEADSLVSARRERNHAHNNNCTNMMLTCLDRHKGVVVFTTNLAAGLDEALERRVGFKLEFKKPDIELRENLWRKHLQDLPAEMEAGACDITQLATEYEFTGGNISNAVQNAIYRIASEERKVIEQKDLLAGAEDELNGMFLKAKSTVRINGFRTQNIKEN